MKYSVVIPVYNKADTIGQSIDSVLNQSVKNFELIVVDDGSTDNIDDVLKQYDKITVVKQANGGVSAARNAGIAAASGEYLCFLDADDLWLPDHLATLDNMMKCFPDENFYITSHDYSLDNNGRHCLDAYPEIFACENFFELINSFTDSEVVHTNSVCIKRAFLAENNLKFAPGERIGEDTDMWLRTALLCRTIKTRRVTTIYRRELSTATKQINSTLNWVFASRIEEIRSGNYNEKRRQGALTTIEQYYITCARDLISLHLRRPARKHLSMVKFNKGKRYYITLALYYMPYCVSRQILKLQKYERRYSKSEIAQA